MEKIVCPEFAYDCIYYDAKGMCQMEKIEGCLPYDECDAFYNEDEEEES